MDCSALMEMILLSCPEKTHVILAMFAQQMMTTHLCPEIQTKLCMHKLRACETNTILHKPNA